MVKIKNPFRSIQTNPQADAWWVPLFIFLKKCFSGTPYCISALENSGADFDNGSKSLCCLNILPIVLDSSLYEAGDLLIMIDTLRYEL